MKKTFLRFFKFHPTFILSHLISMSSTSPLITICLSSFACCPINFENVIWTEFSVPITVFRQITLMFSWSAWGSWRFRSKLEGNWTKITLLSNTFVFEKCSFYLQVAKSQHSPVAQVALEYLVQVFGSQQGLSQWSTNPQSQSSPEMRNEMLIWIWVEKNGNLSKNI